MTSIKQTRIIKGVSAVEVANACGISKQLYCRIENEGVCCTKEEVARKVCDYFGVSLFQASGKNILKFKPKTTKEWKELVSELKKAAAGEK